VLRAPPLLDGDAPGRLPVEDGGVSAFSPRLNKPVTRPLIAAKRPSSAAGAAPPGLDGDDGPPGREGAPEAPGFGASLSPLRFSSPFACDAKPLKRAPMPPPSPAGLSSFLGGGFLSPASSLPRLKNPPAFDVRPPSFAPKPPPPSSFLSSFLSRDAGEDADDPLERSDGLIGPDWKPPVERLPDEDDEPLELPLLEYGEPLPPERLPPDEDELP
jgi:hypothetical protein